MKVLRVLIVLPIVLGLFLSCNKEQEVNTFSCNGLSRALLADDLQEVRNVLAPIISSLEAPANNELAEEKLRSLAGFVDECPVLDASLYCFECVYSTPPQSEIIIKIQTAQGYVSRILDIALDNGRFVIADMHE